MIDVKGVNGSASFTFGARDRSPDMCVPESDPFWPVALEECKSLESSIFRFRSFCVSWYLADSCRQGVSCGKIFESPHLSCARNWMAALNIPWPHPRVSCPRIESLHGRPESAAVFAK